MADASLLPALTGAVVDRVEERPGGSIALGLRLPDWCGRAGHMPRRATLVLEAVAAPATVQATLAAHAAGGTEVLAIEDRSTRAGGARLRIALGREAPLDVGCGAFRVEVDGRGED